MSMSHKHNYETGERVRFRKKGPLTVPILPSTITMVAVKDAKLLASANWWMWTPW